jgi:7-cyano-7-deazaguanine synthase
MSNKSKYKKGVILLSGGIDSAVALWIAKSITQELHAISFDYGQTHKKELYCAGEIAKIANVKSHRIVDIKLNEWTKSSLTDKQLPMETGLLKGKEIPHTYVPARNMVFLSIAASFAEAISASDIYIGVTQIDHAGYVDCRKDFIYAMQIAINKGTVSGTEKQTPIIIHAPLIDKTKTEIISIAQKLGVPLEQTWTCYKGEKMPCGTCYSCLVRANAFAEIGITDPIINQNYV